jgi:TPR repeat protein
MIARFQLFGMVTVCVITFASASAQNQNLDAIRQKAEAGDPIAQFDLARAYIEGKLVTKDPATGVLWLKKSARQDYVGAEYALGIMYENGVGVSKDQHEAAKWFLKAARQQNKAAQEQLSSMLHQGTISTAEADWNIAEPKPARLPKTPTKAKPAPFSLSEVESGLKGSITSKRMATLVQQFGVDFSLSDASQKRLAEAGADANLLQVISASQRSL